MALTFGSARQTGTAAVWCDRLNVVSTPCVLSPPPSSLDKESERCRRRGDPSVLSPRSSGASVNYSAPSHLSPDKTAPARRPDIPRGNCLSLLRAVCVHTTRSSQHAWNTAAPAPPPPPVQKHPHKERLCRTTTHGIRVRLCSNTLPLSRQPSGIPK